MRYLLAAMSLAALLVSANSALADKRVAFVVGHMMGGLFGRR